MVTPGTGQSLVVLPFIRHAGETYFLLGSETRVAALERRVLQPLYDLPIHPRYMNATGFFLLEAEAGAYRRERGHVEGESWCGGAEEGR